MNQSTHSAINYALAVTSLVAATTLPQVALGSEKRSKNILRTVQIRFAQPEAMQISWSPKADGNYSSEPLIVPGSFDFPIGELQWKLFEIPDFPGLELFPSVVIPKPNKISRGYLREARIPIHFTTEDFEQVICGALVTKVVYLPKPEFQQDGPAGAETLASTATGPGLDPVKEAKRRGTILAIIRMGDRNKERLWRVSPGEENAEKPKPRKARKNKRHQSATELRSVAQPRVLIGRQ